MYLSFDFLLLFRDLTMTFIINKKIVRKQSVYIVLQSGNHIHFRINHECITRQLRRCDVK